VIGEVIGNFEVVARAGRGGMGEVFIAEQVAIKTRVAVKVLHAHVSASTAHVQRFFNEARAVARIQHAGIVKIFDAGFHTNRRAYLIMEFLEGETLAARLKRAGRIALRDTVEVARQIASILDATHHAGIIHRDLKPGNVFLVRDRELACGERVKLLDFGIAKLSDTLATSPTTVGAIGTPAYMAPEQWSDASTVDWRADVYSLGCMIYEMATGRPPFATRSVAEACAQHLHEPPRSVRTHAAWIPVEFDAFTLRLLAKDPAQRAATIAELEQQLAELVAIAPAPGDEPAPEPTGEPPQPATQPAAESIDEAPAELMAGPPGRSTATLGNATTAWARTNARRWITAAVAGAALLAIGAVLAWRLGTTGPRRSPARPPVADVTEPGRDAATSAPGPAFAAWLEAENRFVAWQGARWLAHQVTRREYRRFLESLPVADALRLQPVTGWNDRDPAHPVAWVTFERAAAFCRAIGARLPSSEQWLAASDGAWAIDPDGSGPGPLQEWTSTIRDGLVVVCGGHDRMSPSERATAASEPLLKSSEAQAGPNAAPNIVASETIGFRCVR
jgi:tRNA A-37 threonylcarbamoyl transferase component Bud32